MKSATLKCTYGDYRLLPSTGPRQQLLDGEFVVSPSPSLRHQRILRRLLRALCDHVDPRRLGEVFCAPVDVVLSDVDVVQPDLFFVSVPHRRRLARNAVHGPPDLVVEILSRDRDLDLKIKRKLYARCGVPECWIVDPVADTIRLFRLQEHPTSPGRMFAGGDILESPLFPGLLVRLDDLFSP